jgi:hypothetical protein
MTQLYVRYKRALSEAELQNRITLDRFHPEKLIFAQLVNKYQPFREPEILLLYSQELDTKFYLMPDETYCHDLGVTIDGVLDWILDLLTTLTLNS